MSSNFISGMRAYKRPILNVLLMAYSALLFLGCVHLVSYYDSVSYKNLTDLKAHTLLVFDSLGDDPTGKNLESQFNDLRLEIERAYEYEKGKAKNDETVRQLEEIKKMFIETVTLLDKQGSLSEDYVELKREQFEQAFDDAIATERAKLEE